MENPIRLLLNTGVTIEINQARILANIPDSQISLFRSNEEVKLTFINSLSISEIKRVLEVAKIMEENKYELLKLYNVELEK